MSCYIAPVGMHVRVNNREAEIPEEILCNGALSCLSELWVSVCIVCSVGKLTEPIKRLELRTTDTQYGSAFLLSSVSVVYLQITDTMT